MAVLLAACFRLCARDPGFARPLQVFGQTALFFYLLHLHLMGLTASALGLARSSGVLSCHGGALAVCVVQCPACRRASPRLAAVHLSS